MFFSFVVALVVLALVAQVLAKKRWALFSTGVNLVIFFLIGCGLIPYCLVSTLQSNPLLQNPNWSQSPNVIIVLGGGALSWPGSDEAGLTLFSTSRVLEAARLYHDCHQHSQECRVILSGGDPVRLGTTEAETMKRSLLGLGIPQKDLILEDQSLNTYQNAQFSTALLKKMFPSSSTLQPILVTSGMHIRRSLLYFSYFGISGIPAPSDHIGAKLTLWPNSLNFFLADHALNEAIGMARLWVYDFMGWNGPRHKQ